MSLVSIMERMEGRLAERVRLLAYFLLATDAVAVLSSFLLYPASYTQQRFWSLVISLLAVISAVILLVFAATRYARVAVYVALIFAVSLIAAIDPLSGNLGGGTWVLFQIIPPVAALVLREPRAAIIMALVTLTLFIPSVFLQIGGVFPVTLLAHESSLYFNLAMQSVVMLVLAGVITLITRKEQQSFDQVMVAQQESASQLLRVNELLEDQQRLNEDLARSIAETRERDAQILREQAFQAELRQKIAIQAVPFVPILPGVVVVPLVGTFDLTRLADLVAILLKGIEERRVRTLVLDVTGVETVDAALAQALLAGVNASRLLGTQVIVVGVSPEAAQSLVSLGVDLSSLQPKATLAEAVKAVIRQQMN